MRNPKEQLETIQSLIQKGFGNEAKIALAKLTARRLPREFVCFTAELSRRADAAEIGVRVLYPVVREAKCEAAEKLEYAACLIKTGSIDEGLNLLRSTESRDPKRLFYQALGLIAKWDYQESIGVLLNYMEAVSNDPYRMTVGQLNLASAFVFEGHYSESNAHLNKIIDRCEKAGWNLLLGNALELSSQNSRLQKRFKEARAFITRAETILKDSGGLFQLFAKKAHVFLELEERG